MTAPDYEAGWWLIAGLLLILAAHAPKILSEREALRNPQYDPDNDWRRGP